VLKKLSNFIKKNRGQAVVEFALVLPILVLILFGVLEGGNVLYRTLTVTEASREGARVAAVNVGKTNLETLATSAIQKFSSSTLTMTQQFVYKDASGAVVSSAQSGGSVEVIVTANVTIVTPIINKLFTPNPYPVKGTTTMRVE